MIGSFYGIFLSVVIALVSFLISTFHHSFDALVISIILGMITANLFESRAFLDKGIQLSLKIFLPVGIALYGTQLTVSHVNPYFLLAVVVVFLAMFFLIYFVSKTSGIDGRLGILLATGFSVCGASAIAIVSPVIDARNEDTSLSVIVVMIYGLTGMVIYPVIGEILNLSYTVFAFLAGTTLPMLGQVKVTASGYSKDCINCLELAVKFKLLRMSMLFFIVTVGIFLSNVKNKKFYVPWFVVVFVALSLVVNIFQVPWLTSYSTPISKFSLSTALAAIGLSIEFDSVAEGGLKPLFAVGISWAIVLIIIYMVLGFLNV